ncbi:MAG: nuclear transport factor 2 family protein [Myxococcota bacterium]
MIEKTIENWHRNIRGEFPGGLDELLDDDCVFYSPIVFTPQKGKAVSKMYLEAAGSTFSGSSEPTKGVSDLSEQKFRYVNQVMSGNVAVLEFESEVDGKYINGVDIITCNPEGRIVEFKVMVRPLQAVNLLHAKMKAMLEKMQAAG